MVGKIIAVVGAPGSGKSFLVKRLKEHFNAEAFFEGEVNTLPKRILENFSNKTRHLETILWFRNQRVNDFLKAEQLKKNGKNVILDTFWISNQFYVDSMLEGFEKEIALSLGNLDTFTLNKPDLVIFLQVNNENVLKFVRKRGRDFEQDNEFIQRILKINKEHEDFFNKNKFQNLLIIKRDELDFENDSDFNLLLTKIKEILSIRNSNDLNS